MGATIESINVVFGGTVDTLLASVTAGDSALVSIGVTAEEVGASLASLGGEADAASVSLDSIAAAGDAAGVSSASASEQLAVLGEEAATASAEMDSLSAATDATDASLATTGASADAVSTGLASAGTAASATAEGLSATAASATEVDTALAGTAAAADATSASLASTTTIADAATASLDATKEAAKGFGLVALGLGVIGAVSIKAAGDFNAGMLTIKTGAGGLHENIAQLSQQVLGLSTATGTGTKGLVDGLFMIESAGQRGSGAINTLAIAAEAAKVGNADLGTVANGVTTIMTDFASSNITAAQAANSLVAAVGDGKTNMQDLSASLSSILPVASSTKVGLNDVMGAMADMTGQGVPAAYAATYLRQMLMTLASPSKAGAAALQEIGLSAQQVSDDMKKSLPDTLKMIEDHLTQKFPEGSIAYQDALKAIAGGSKQMQGMLDLTGSHLDTFGQDVNDIAGRVKSGGNAVLGWSDVQQSFNFKMDQAKSSLEVLGITLGTKLLPLLAPLIGNIATLVSGFTSWLNSGHAVSDALSLTGKYAQIALPILAGLGALVLAIIVPAFWAWASATIAATWPILAIVAAVTGVVAIFVLLYQHVAPFRAFIDMLVSGFKEAAAFVQANFIPAMQAVGSWLNANVMPVLKQIGTFLATTFMQAWQQLVAIWNAQVLPALRQLGTWMQANVLPIILLIGNTIRSNFLPTMQQIGTFLLSVFQPVWQQLVDLWRGQLMPLFAQLVGAIQPLWQTLQQLWNLIEPILLPALTLLGAVLGTVLVMAIANIVGVFRGLLSAIGAIVSGIITFVGGIVQVVTGVVQILAGIVRVIVDLITGNFGDLGSALGSIWQGILNVVQGVWKAIAGVFQVVFGSISAFVSGFVQGIVGFFQWLANILINHSIIPDMLTAITQAITTFITAIITAVQAFVQMLVQVFTNFGTAALTVWNDFLKGVTVVWTAIVSIATTEWNTVSTVIMNIVHALQTTLATAWTNVQKGFSNAFGALAGIAQSVWSNIVGIVKSAIDNFISLINNMINGVNNVTSKIGIPSIPDIPLLGAGGTVQPGAYAIAGEHGPEIIAGGTSGVSVLGTSQTAASLAAYQSSGRFGGANGGKTSLTIPVILNGRQMAVAMVDDLETLLLGNLRGAANPRVGGY